MSKTSRLKSAIPSFFADKWKKSSYLYNWLGPLKRRFWFSILLLFGQSIWTGVLLTSLAALLNSLRGNMAPSKADIHTSGYFRMVFHNFDRIPPAYRPVWGFILAGVSMLIASLIELGVLIYISDYSTLFICRMREMIFSGLIKNSLTFHDNHKKGTLLQILIPEVRNCYSVIKVFLNVVVDFFNFTVYVIFACLLSLKLSFLVVFLGGLLMTEIYLYSFRLKRNAAESLRVREDLMVSAEEGLGGIKQLKLLNFFSSSFDLFNARCYASEQAARHGSILSQLQDTIAVAMSMATIMILIFVNYKFSVLPLPSLILFLIILKQLTTCLQGMNSRFNLFVTCLPAINRVKDFLELSKLHVETSGPRITPVLIQQSISYEDVSLDYGAHKSVLRGISFRVEKNQHIALVGPSGSGKTSIVNLLVRLYTPTHGHVLIDGFPIETFDLTFLRERIGIVNQEPIIFNTTVKENILMAKPHASEEELMQAVKNAHAQEFIERMPQGYDTLVGDRGVKLSGGQRQRVHIAQIFLKDPEILILDEATSALDSESEHWIHEALMQLTRHRTVFTIAHRLSTIRQADRILVVQNGLLAETGTWAQLMETDGLFHRMVERQSFVAPAKESLT